MQPSTPAVHRTRRREASPSRGVGEPRASPPTRLYVSDEQSLLMTDLRRRVREAPGVTCDDGDSGAAGAGSRFCVSSRVIVESRPRPAWPQAARPPVSRSSIHARRSLTRRTPWTSCPYAQGFGRESSRQTPSGMRGPRPAGPEGVLTAAGFRYRNTEFTRRRPARAPSAVARGRPRARRGRVVLRIFEMSASCLAEGHREGAHAERACVAEVLPAPRAGLARTPVATAAVDGWAPSRWGPSLREVYRGVRLDRAAQRNDWASDVRPRPRRVVRTPAEQLRVGARSLAPRASRGADVRAGRRFEERPAQVAP